MDVLREIRNIAIRVSGDFDTSFFTKVFKDTKQLFEGHYPGYRASNTKYHDFNHTVSVTLATARLIHGCTQNGQAFQHGHIQMALAAALFHDAGLIQESKDQEGSGAKYTIGHEERSILFMRKYLTDANCSPEDIENCSRFIRCTILHLPPKGIDFPTDEIRNLGFIVGSADLSAQLADRLYLEKLLLLYQEFEEARLPGFDTELELLKKTKDFYKSIAKKRLIEDLGGVCLHMRSHFKQRYGVDKDLYYDSIEKNIKYLDSLVVLCANSIACYLENLRRGGIAKKITETLN